MADTSASVGDARPLLAFGPPTAGAIPPRDGPPPFRPVKKPSPSRQGERLTPQFQVLHEALAGQRAQLADTTTASDPELVVVFDLAGTVDQFMRACAKVDGLEFLADLQEDQVDGDDDGLGDACDACPATAANDGGATDGGAIHLHNLGVPTVVIGVPSRHIHSHGSIIHRDDYDNAVKLVAALVSRLDAATVAGLTN